MKKRIMAIIALLICAVSASAFGYIFEKTDQGVRLAWDFAANDGAHANATQVIYHLNCAFNVAAANQDQCHTLFDNSFGTWESVPTTSIAFLNGGDSAQTTAGSDSINLLLFVENDPDLSGNVIALTTTFYDIDGSILDSDIRFNASRFNFFDSTAANYQSLQGIATHEIGHVIGLDHSMVAYVGNALTPSIIATMFFAAVPGMDQENLKQDDKSGISAIYPNSSATPEGAVTGTVTNNTGPIFGTHVTLLDSATGVPLVASVSGPDGNYSIQWVPTGQSYKALCEPIMYPSTLAPYYQNVQTSYNPVLYNNHQLTSFADAAPPSAVFAAAETIAVTSEAPITSINCVVNYAPPHPDLLLKEGGGGSGCGCSMEDPKSGLDWVWLILAVGPIFVLRLAKKWLGRMPKFL